MKVANELHQRVVGSIQTYYAVLAVAILFIGLPSVGSLKSDFSPPLAWYVSFLGAFQFKFILLFSLLGSVFFALTASFWPNQSLPRRITFILFFLYEGLYGSIGGRTHLYQFWLWSAAILALIPTQPCRSKPQNLGYIVGWWGSLSIILMFYGLSGMWKVIGCFQQIVAGEPSILSPKGLLYHIASEKIRAGVNPPLFSFLKEHQFLNPPLELLVTLLQVSCFYAIFNTKWHRPIGLILILFHIGTYFILSITYPTNMLLLATTLAASPFQFKVSPKQFFKLIVRKPHGAHLSESLRNNGEQGNRLS